MTDVQHCTACATEYLAGVTVCADCGGSLTAGPLPQQAPDADRPTPGVRPRASDDPPDHLVTQMPGLQAEHAVKLLTLEGITCLMECGGIRRLRRAGDDPTEPFAVTLPVSIYVPNTQLGEAREILQSVERDDVIGNQWQRIENVDVSEESAALEPERENFTDAPREAAMNDMAAPGRPSLTPRIERTSLRFVVLLILVALLFLVLQR